MASIVLMVGPFPTPLHGFSLANSRMENALKALGLDVRRIDVAPGRGDSWFSRARDYCGRVLDGFLAISRRESRFRDRICYLGLSGGSRQVLDAFFVSLARLFGWRLIIHHHSFAYINSFSRLTYVVMKIAGANAMHIALSDKMAEMLGARYTSVRHVKTLSNISLAELSAQFSHRAGVPRAIGYLSNITIEKGFDQFLRIHEAAVNAGLQVTAVIGGPMGDSESRQLLDVAVARGLPIRYLGPVYGEMKQAFFTEIDLFIFPTRYLNEAEPFVIIEALSAGVAVISTPRGCIPELLSNGGGFLIDSENVEAAVQIIADGFSNPSDFERIRLRARAAFTDLSSQAERQWIGITEQFLCGGETPKKFDQQPNSSH